MSNRAFTYIFFGERIDDETEEDAESSRIIEQIVKQQRLAYCQTSYVYF